MTWFVFKTGARHCRIPIITPAFNLQHAFHNVNSCMSIFVQNTFFWWWSKVQRRPFSDSVPAILIHSPPLLPLAAGQKDVSAVKIQEVVGFAVMPLTAKLQPKGAASAALLQFTQTAFEREVGVYVSFESSMETSLKPTL